MMVIHQCEICVRAHVCVLMMTWMVQVVDGLLAPGAVLVPDFWANWVQGEI